MLSDPTLAERYECLNQYTAPVKKPERAIVGRVDEMRRIRAAMLRPELCNVILLGEAGSGKALSDDTPIPVCDSRGYVPIGSITKNDRVFDRNGKPCRVMGVYHQGLRRAYEVVFEDQSSIICNDEHLWIVRQKSLFTKKNEYMTMSLRDILLKARVDVGAKGPQMLKNWFVPNNRGIQRPRTVSDANFYVLGVLLTAGSFWKGHLVLSGLPLGVTEKCAAKLHCQAISCESVGRDRAYLLMRGVGHKECGAYLFCDDKLEGFPWILDDLLSDCCIPDFAMVSELDARQDLLSGLLDAGGHFHRDPATGRLDFYYQANSETMAESVRELMASLGLRVSAVTTDYIGNQLVYRLHILLTDQQRRRLSKHSSALESDETVLSQYPDVVQCLHGRSYGFGDTVGHEDESVSDLRIVSVERLGMVPMTCIYVESDDHSYQAGRSHIVTHNTMLVQGTMMKDTERTYLEVDLSRMIADCQTDVNEMATKLKTLFDETSDYCKTQNTEIVLFIDEFHQIVQLSEAAVEALKPLLADSGTRGIRVIAATTYVEFRKFIAPNQPLVERLQRINISQPNKEMVVDILKGMAKRYGVDNQFRDDRIFEMIYEYTNRYIPANSQPRKSLIVMDAMIGWHRAEERPLDMRLLADVIYESEGVNTTFRVDATKIKEALDKRVYSQQMATSIIEERLQICVADLNNKTKPMSSFLFTGSTGTGKMLDDDELIPVYSTDGSIHHKRNGDLQVGDYVFNREGKPVRITGVFPQGVQDVYEVEFADGRSLRCGAGHLWAYRLRQKSGVWQVADTKTLMERYETKYFPKGRTVHEIKYCIPMNGAVQYPAQDYPVDPYVVGAFLEKGDTNTDRFALSMVEYEMAAKVGDLLQMPYLHSDAAGKTWTFCQTVGGPELDWSSVFAKVPVSSWVEIPEIYKYGSIEQRWKLIQGIFDASGYISATDNYRYRVRYSSPSVKMVCDVQDVLFSLGIQSSISEKTVRSMASGRSSTEYMLYVKCGNADKINFFTVSEKADIAAKAADADVYKKRVKKFDSLGIRDIRKLPEQASMTCIMVDDDEHLYQAGQYIVTHNTEMTKALAEVLFSDDRSLIRFDMTEYANNDSLERFRHELTARIWERPYSIVLLDEIEKACAPVTRILLQVLDDGRLMDENNREVVFTNCYMILTTNAGSEVYRNISHYNVDDTGSGEQMKKYNKLIRASIAGTTGDNRFPPELLGRIDCIVPFQPLSEATMKKIVKSKLLKLKDEVARKHNIQLRIHPNVIRYLVEDNMDTDSDSGGARAVMSKLEAEVTTAVSRYINAHPFTSALGVSVEGELASDNKYKLVSEAKIVVKPVR